ncbi:NADH:flavin oxidoreductase/NADH oxidase [Agaricicola taiwanensis]|nr:NADH:flavin oxidoreductase/NADH oxidase [Agaricicola taiwanensis]
MLFSPLDLRGVRLKNRIVLAPMLTYAAEHGRISDWHLAHLGKFAVGGVGLVFMESTKVDPRGCTTIRDAGLWKDDFIEPLRRVTDFIKAQGAVPGIQLSHSGRKARHSVPWEGRAPLLQAVNVEDGGEWDLIGPSAAPHAEGYPVPRELTSGEIKDLIGTWGQAADRARRAGFDVIELHAAHGYLIHEFLSPDANRRTDAYGGSFANRIRFAVEVVDEVRRYWPDEKPLFVRISSVDDMGWTIEDSVALARVLKAHGVDVIDCSSGGIGSHTLDAAQPPDYGYQVPFAERIRTGADIITMAVGLIIHADQAESILNEGRADLVALGRELLHNPNWSIDAAQKLGYMPSSAGIPEAYGYWLDKRSASGFAGKPSTWQRGI